MKVLQCWSVDHSLSVIAKFTLVAYNYNGYVRVVENTQLNANAGILLKTCQHFLGMFLLFF